MGYALLIYADSATFRQKYVELRRVVRVGTRDQTPSGCDNLRWDKSG